MRPPAARALLTALLLAVGAAGTMAGATGCATIDPWTDQRIEAEVKAQLVAEKDANLTRLGVVSTERTVHLIGRVVSDDQRARAGAIAQGVPGVRRVVNEVEVRPAE
jgi:osmotically-inducible protein OsmY